MRSPTLTHAPLLALVASRCAALATTLTHAPLLALVAQASRCAALAPHPTLVAGTSLEGKRLELAYVATEHGWDALDFHGRCDDRGSTLVECETRGGLRFGGFNPLGYMSSDDYGSSVNAFIYFFAGDDDAPTRCAALGSGDGCVYDYAKGGPTFGAADLVVGRPKSAVMGGFSGPDTEDMSIGQGSLRTASSSPGGAYARHADWPAAAIAAGELAEVRAWVNADVRPQGSGGGGGGAGWWPF